MTLPRSRVAATPMPDLIAPVVMLAALLCVGMAPVVHGADERAPRSDGVGIYSDNPRYWQYKGRPAVLLGGSDAYNLFQRPDLKQQLDLLAAVGGNYVRNSMSAREPGDVQPFARRPDGRYDLTQWNEEYWHRFETLLRLTRDADVIVQIEVWDRFDYSGDQWQDQPLNPKNNVNYSYTLSGFVAHYPDHPSENQQPFFFTTPKQRNNVVVLRYQQRFVDEMLRRALRYPNVIFCIDNETSGEEAWAVYWAEYIKQHARSAGTRAYVTQMWDDWDPRAPQHRRTLDHPERYDYVDVSQNNHQRGESHWRGFQWVHRYLGDTPRPINAVKTYGADTDDRRSALDMFKEWVKRVAGRALTTDTPDNYGTTQEGNERWWRQLIGGAAAVRFHRPRSGLGLTPVAQQQLRSARLFLREFDIVRAVPDAKHERLAQRAENEAYLTHIADEAYAVYFPDRGDVRLTVSPTAPHTLTWLNISTGRWELATDVVRNDTVRLRTPGPGQWLALVQQKTPR